MASACLPWIQWLVAGLLLCTSIAAEAAELSADERSRVDAAVQAEVDTLQIAGCAVGVLRDGEIVYLGVYGEADRERHLPVTTETVFNWASNSKPVVAVLLMQLVEQGKLSLDDDVCKYVENFPRKKWPVLVRDILCHQSGLPHYSNGTILGTERAYSDADAFLNPVNAVDRFNRSPLIFEPRTRVSYSSYAYVLLSAVVQQAAAEPIETLLRRRITEPLALESFQLDVETSRPEWAVGYIRDESGAVVRAKDVGHYWKHGAGGYKSNVRDFARWAQAILRGELLSRETTRLMSTNQELKDGTTTDWGLGMKIERDGESWKVSHNGGQEETRTRMVLYPDQRHGVVVMCNSSYIQPSALTTAVYRALRPAAVPNSSKPSQSQ